MQGAGASRTEKDWKVRISREVGSQETLRWMLGCGGQETIWSLRRTRGASRMETWGLSPQKSEVCLGWASPSFTPLEDGSRGTGGGGGWPG